MYKYFKANIPLSELTTFETGGPALWLALPENTEELRETLRWAAEHKLPFYPLGDGSNILASDDGFKGVAIRLENKGITCSGSGSVLVTAQAGTVWDDLVAFTVEHNLAGLECLSAIPGRVGAAPVQNIGAYGQEAANCLESLEVIDVETLQTKTIAAQECEFGYRTSCFKTKWRGRFIITSVSFRLEENGVPALRYGDLERFFGDKLAQNPDWRPALREVREAVASVRRSKSMAYDKADPNHRCAGSFFLNPIVPAAKAAELQKEWPSIPIYPAGDDSLRKLSAAWLVENAGFPKGFRQGRAGLSSRHTLCFINAGGADTKEILALSGTVTAKIEQMFGIKLHPEPNMLGF